MKRAARLISIITMFALLISLCVPVFADDETPQQGTESRVVTFYLSSGSVDGDDWVYKNSGRVKDGDETAFEVTTDQNNITFTVANGLAADFTPEDPGLVEFERRPDNMYNVKVLAAGSTVIRIDVSGDTTYKPATYWLNLKIRDLAAEKAEAERLAAEKAEAERLAAEKAAAAKAAAIKKAKSLKAPVLKCSKRMKRANKLSWNKVTNASGYELYIKYPGAKKYVKALKKNSTVKSVTHKGLKRKKYYYYKLRAYAVAYGKTYYGPFSKAIKVKVK